MAKRASKLNILRQHRFRDETGEDRRIDRGATYQPPPTEGPNRRPIHETDLVCVGPLPKATFAWADERHHQGKVASLVRGPQKPADRPLHLRTVPLTTPPRPIFEVRLILGGRWGAFRDGLSIGGPQPSADHARHVLRQHGALVSEIIETA